jgi:hypothetical protein
MIYVKINDKNIDHAMAVNVSIYVEHAWILKRMLQANVQEENLWCKE